MTLRFVATGSLLTVLVLGCGSSSAPTMYYMGPYPGADGGSDAPAKTKTHSDAASESAAPAFDAGPLPDDCTGCDEVPLTVHSQGGAKTFSVAVKVGNTTVEALLDTGSYGLRILPSAGLKASDYTKTSTTNDATYPSGLTLSGTVAKATVTLGTRSTAAPIPIAIVSSIGCDPTVPACPGSSGDLSSFLIGADGTKGAGFHAVMGIGMRNDPASGGVANPIVQLPGEPAFIIHVSSFGAPSGLLRIGPTAKDETAFKTMTLPPYSGGAALANGVASWDDQQVPVCVDDTTQMLDYCALALLDTGSPQADISWVPYMGTSPFSLPSGDELVVGFGPKGAPFNQATFTVGSPAVEGDDEILVSPASGASSMDLGVFPFFRFDVLMDQKSGLVGLATR